ncbi:non-histone protein, partial [Coemansia guatemalensis]
MVDVATVEKHHKYRCRELRRQLEELEGYNDILAVKLQKSQKRLRRMKIERNILLERFEHTRRYKHDDDSSDSDAPLRNTFPRAAAADNDADQSYAAGAPTGSGSHRGRRKAAAAGVHTNSNSSNGSTPRQTSVHNTAANGEHPVTPVGGSTRKPRAEKDPNAPKRPANAFVLYCQVERPNIKSAGTELSSSELTRAMGVKWRNLSEDKKQKYFDMYEREMARYNREMATYKCTSAPNGSTTPVTAAAGPVDLADDGSVANVASSPAAPSMDVDDEEEDDEKSQPPTANGDATETGEPKTDDHHQGTASEVVTPSTMA